MPRAKLPVIADEATDRWFLEYATPFGRHEIKFRSGHVAGTDAVTASLISYCNAVKDLLYNSVVFDKLRHANAGQKNSFPIAWTPIAGTGSGLAMERKRAANFLSFTGRTLGGRFVTHKQFGTFFTPDDNFRLQGEEGNLINDVYTLLNGAGWVITAKDSQKPIYNQYANMGVHAYFQRKLRRQA